MAPLLLVLSLHFCSWQKPVIDTNAIDHWPSLSITPVISAHGSYLAYSISRQLPPNPHFVIRASRGTWKKEFTGVTQCYFSGDEKQAIVPKGDSLFFIKLGTDSLRAVRARSFQWPPEGGGRWFACQMEGALILMDLRTGKKEELGPAKQYAFDRQGRALIVTDTMGLSFINLETGDRKRIYTTQPGDELQDVQWDEAGTRLAFVIHGMNNSVWYYRVRDSGARMKVQGEDIGGPVQFSRNGHWLFFTRAQPSPPPPKTKPAGPLIWTWQDTHLQPDAAPGPGNYWAVVATDGDTPKQVKFPNRRLLTPPALVMADWILVSDTATYWLVSLADGTQRPIGTRGGYPADFCFSPGGKWFVYYNPGMAQYIGCELKTGALHAISAHLPRSISSEFPRGVDPQPVAAPAGWLQGDRAVLLYDNYDLWAIDPAGKRNPLNLTGGYGLQNHVKLRITEERDALGAPLGFSQGDTLLLTGFNTINKYSGFFRLVLGRKPTLDSLFMGPYTFYRVESQKPHRYSFDDGMKPLKAAEADCWLVKRQSAREAPNYLLTTDFRHFEPMTMLAPQKDYNWITAQLIDYHLPDGSLAQGVLYKPEDFDPGKKYPVLFTIYERYSHRLYEFPHPDLSRDNIDIPWFVSRGYLVFTPDIRYRPANSSNRTIGSWAYLSVLAAVRYLSRMPFVDVRRLGIQGHSLGAEELDDILVKTGIFSAAAEMAGPTDPVSAYLTLENPYIWERGQARMGVTPWQRPDLYMDESAVLHADKIITPLLIIHNPRDAAVQYRQGVELFLALRRLKKPVWMLQYPEEGHSIFQTDAAFDYTTRLTDFFGHFLKDQPLPAWMGARR